MKCSAVRRSLCTHQLPGRVLLAEMHEGADPVAGDALEGRRARAVGGIRGGAAGIDDANALNRGRSGRGK